MTNDDLTLGVKLTSIVSPFIPPPSHALPLSSRNLPTNLLGRMLSLFDSMRESPLPLPGSGRCLLELVLRLILFVVCLRHTRTGDSKSTRSSASASAILDSVCWRLVVCASVASSVTVEFSSSRVSETAELDPWEFLWELRLLDNRLKLLRVELFLDMIVAVRRTTINYKTFSLVLDGISRSILIVIDLKIVQTWKMFNFELGDKNCFSN